MSTASAANASEWRSMCEPRTYWFCSERWRDSTSRGEVEQKSPDDVGAFRIGGLSINLPADFDRLEQLLHHRLVLRRYLVERLVLGRLAVDLDGDLQELGLPVLFLAVDRVAR